LTFVSTWNVVALEFGVGALVAAGVGLGASVAAGVSVPPGTDDDVVGFTAVLAAGCVPQPPSGTTLRMTAAIIRARTLVQRLGGQPVTEARLEARRSYS